MDDDLEDWLEEFGLLCPICKKEIKIRSTTRKPDDSPYGWETIDVEYCETCGDIDNL